MNKCVWSSSRFSKSSTSWFMICWTKSSQCLLLFLITYKICQQFTTINFLKSVCIRKPTWLEHDNGYKQGITPVRVRLYPRSGPISYLEYTPLLIMTVNCESSPNHVTSYPFTFDMCCLSEHEQEVLQYKHSQTSFRGFPTDFGRPWWIHLYINWEQLILLKLSITVHA